MKFFVENLTKCEPRLGVLKEFERDPEHIIETPAVMLYTKGSSLPHITHDVFKIICQGPQIIQIPLISAYHYQDIMEEFIGPVTKFIGMGDCLTCVTVQDPGDIIQRDYLWTRNGKRHLNTQQYMHTIASFKPDMYYFLSDGDTNAKSGTRRVSRAVSNSLNYFKHCLEVHRKSDCLRDTFVMASIVGGYSRKARKKCIDGMIKAKLVKGYMIDGLHNNGPEVEFISFNELKPIIQFVINHLPEDKMRVVQGTWNPVVILKMVQLGVDIFDTSYCNLVTERSCALIFSLDINLYSEDHPYEINLRQSRFFEEFKPILQNCQCLTCRKYTRAYIHHLIITQELSGPLLLTIHNNHHYMKFFEKIRHSVKNGTIKFLEVLMKKQFSNHLRLA